MTMIEKKSLASQINISVYELRKYQEPMALHVVNYDDELTKESINSRGGE